MGSSAGYGSAMVLAGLMTLFSGATTAYAVDLAIEANNQAKGAVAADFINSYRDAYAALGAVAGVTTLGLGAVTRALKRD